MYNIIDTIILLLIIRRRRMLLIIITNLGHACCVRMRGFGAQGRAGGFRWEAGRARSSAMRGTNALSQNGSSGKVTRLLSGSGLRRHWMEK